MTIKVPYRGIVEIVGEHDAGKTIAALQTVGGKEPYKKTVFVDDDVKSDSTVKQMREAGIEFEDYIDMASMRVKLGDTPSPSELLNRVVLPTVERIAKGKHEVVIWDTWRIVYQAARGHVERNQHQYRDVVKFQGSSQIVQGLISKVARMIEQTQLNKLKASCELLIVTHHIKDWYANNVVVGVIPESSATFGEVSNMRMWLRRNTQSKVPIILFLKRPSVPKLVNGEMRFTNIVPMKVVPNDKDQSIWTAIKRYEENPVESRKLTPEERPTAEEMSIIRGTLNDDQKAYVQEVLKHQKDDEQAIVSAVTGNSKNGGAPKSAAQLYMYAMSDLDMDGDKVEELSGIPTEEMMELSADEISEVWDKLKHNKGK